MSDEPTQPTDDSAARHERVKAIFAHALALPESERAAYLESECGDDEALRAEVESLLAHATEASTMSALQEPVALTADPLLGRKLGRYHIKHVIGTGGMGTVYQAMQEQPRRVVALKVMKRGIASRSALRRFEYEAQILARLRDPGIAQIYEAGVHEEGGESVPFFAMEYIPAAMPITRYAEQKKLGTRERLDLFARVCDAVQHGHGKGIIHRDLKPSNILVDSSGQPKIIDFGVARSTDSDLAVTTLQTDIGQLIGTLQYMSPEQCLADPIDLDTRSDVYALGVVLYELLCGKMPYDVSRAAVFEATRVIQEASPARPSTLNKTLRGDVETVVLKALEKDRERRYRSAAEFGEDLRRYLNNEPISAQPPSLRYQVRMFARKNKTVFRAGVVVLLALIAGLLVASTGMTYGLIQNAAAQHALTEKELALVKADAALASERVETARAEARLAGTRWLLDRARTSTESYETLFDTGSQLYLQLREEANPDQLTDADAAERDALSSVRRVTDNAVPTLERALSTARAKLTGPPSIPGNVPRYQEFEDAFLLVLSERLPDWLVGVSDSLHRWLLLKLNLAFQAGSDEARTDPAFLMLCQRRTAMFLALGEIQAARRACEATLSLCDSSNVGPLSKSVFEAQLAEVLVAEHNLDDAATHLHIAASLQQPYLFAPSGEIMNAASLIVHSAQEVERPDLSSAASPIAEGRFVPATD